ncbi:unnamed protein product [Pleuronectes platessa]|uniref:Uncharacterized protein n=1 Tax=Pleuronectes platessa TaxID=8262 RepID=A0A9N7VBM9_PLEPL|nr:unnamed protein product [Pleuronectes platessa]
MKKRSRTRRRRRRPLGNTRRFQIFRINTDLSRAEFIRHVPPPAALQAPPLLLYRLRPSPGCSHMFLFERVGPDNLLLLLHKHQLHNIRARTDPVTSHPWSRPASGTQTCRREEESSKRVNELLPPEAVEDEEDEAALRAAQPSGNTPGRLNVPEGPGRLLRNCPIDVKRAEWRGGVACESGDGEV